MVVHTRKEAIDLASRILESSNKVSFSRIDIEDKPFGLAIANNFVRPPANGDGVIVIAEESIVYTFIEESLRLGYLEDKLPEEET